MNTNLGNKLDILMCMEIYYLLWKKTDDQIPENGIRYLIGDSIVDLIKITSYSIDSPLRLTLNEYQFKK